MVLGKRVKCREKIRLICHPCGRFDPDANQSRVGHAFLVANHIIECHFTGKVCFRYKDQSGIPGLNKQLAIILNLSHTENGKHISVRVRIILKDMDGDHAVLQYRERIV